MKRYLILCLLLSLLIPCMVIPASASSWSNSDIEDIIGSVQTIEADLYDWFEQWYAYFFEATEKVNDVSGAEALVTPFKYDLIQVQMYVWSWISDVFDSINSKVSSIYSILNSNFPDLMAYMDSFKTRLTNIAYFVEYYPKQIAHYFTYEEVRIYRYSYKFTADGLEVSFDPVNVTGFIADLDELFEPIRSFFVALLQGDYIYNSEINEEVNADQTEASEILDILDDVTKPDEGELEDIADISGYVDSGDVTALAEVFKPLFESAVFLPCIMLNLTFMLVGYVLFGKR